MPTSRIVRILRALVLLGAGLAVVLVLLYQFAGLRYMPGGSGMPSFGFLAGNEEQAAEIERHRAAQRLGASAASVPPSPASPVQTVEPAEAELGAGPASRSEERRVGKGGR